MYCAYEVLYASGPTLVQSGRKKMFVWLLILVQSAALPGPSKVDTKALLETLNWAPLFA